MRKTLLLFFVLTSLGLFSQSTCQTALEITPGTYVTGAINGTHPGSVTGWCWGTNNAAPTALWYKFTPASSGLLTVSSVLAANPGGTTGIDSRLSIITGTCGGPYVCVGANDDVTSSDYRAEVSNLQVTGGTTYYIVWDNRWQATSFSFSLTFTAASCFSPTTHYLPEYPSTTSATLYWDQVTPNPTNYQVDWSNNLTLPAGSGTLVTITPGTQAFTAAPLTGLPASSNFRYFVRSLCSSSSSEWEGPYFGYLPTGLPYSNGFEDASKNFRDGFVGFSLFNSTSTTTPANYADGGAGYLVYTFNSTSAVSNARAYLRALNLQAGEQVTLTFKSRLWSETSPSNMSFNVTVGSSPSAAAQTNILQTFNNSVAAQYTTHTVNFTPTTAGIYYFSIHNNSPIGTNTTFMMFDSISVTSNLSTSENIIFEGFSLYPNPASNLFSISSNKNELIKNVIVTDLNGRTIKTFGTNQTNFDISDLNSGVYLIEIKGENSTEIKKLVKK